MGMRQDGGVASESTSADVSSSSTSLRVSYVPQGRDTSLQCAPPRQGFLVSPYGPGFSLVAYPLLHLTKGGSTRVHGKLVRRVASSGVFPISSVASTQQAPEGSSGDDGPVRRIVFGGDLMPMNGE